MKKFKNAIEGIIYEVKTEYNFKIHIIATLIVLLFGIYYEVSSIEWYLLLILIGLVFMAESFNTALEITLDIYTKEYNLEVKRAKDIAAGAVFLVVLVAVVIGLFIFIPKIF